MSATILRAAQPALRLSIFVHAAAITMVVFIIRCYQAMIRPHLIGMCKFCPSCSEYGIEALRVHGLVGGFVLTVRRLIRCHPLGPGGFDPVPYRTNRRNRGAPE